MLTQYLVAGASIAGLLGGLWLGVEVGQHRLAEYKLEENQRLLKAAKKADEQRIEQQEKSDELDVTRAAEAADIGRRLVDATDRLRNRVPRASGTPACTGATAGATGAGLSREDAGFLNGESARANSLRSALARCYGAIDSQATGDQVN